MRFRLFVVFCILCSTLLAAAGDKISSSQLIDFVRSSLAMKYEDGKIAKYVKSVTLTDKLDRKALEDLEAQGAGPKTIKALESLLDQAADKKNSGPAQAQPQPPQQSPITSSLSTHYEQPPPPSSVDQAKILDAMRQYANTYTEGLPNYFCVQVTQRYVSFDGGKDYQFEDKIMTKLNYENGVEHYKVYLVNNKIVDTDLEKLGGAKSSGEFGSLMKSLFATKSEAEFGWEKWSRLGPTVVAVFNYFIDSGHSDYMLDYENGAQRIVTAYKGLIYAEPNTGVIRRITFEAVDVPAGFPIRDARTILEYGDQDIGGQMFILPLRAFVTMTGPNNIHVKNNERFTMYRKFGADTTITFGTDALTDTNTKPEEPAEDPVMKGLPPPPPK